MKYRQVIRGSFRERPNRFVAQVEIQSDLETVHVKNTGRCEELFLPGAPVYVTEAENPSRKTRYDLIAVEKGERLINVDAAAPNQAVSEWLEEGHLFPDVTRLQPEYTFDRSRMDFYLETAHQKILLEVKGVTLEEAGVVRFPDAPSLRALKHVEELSQAVQDGYEAYLLFVIQMKDVRYFTPNRAAQPAFADALMKAQQAGVHILAYDCRVTPDTIQIADPVPVVLGEPLLYEIQAPLLRWYRENKRDLPWRRTKDPYRIWVSEIMLQQTRVETVKAYYERFLAALPTVKDLAAVPEDQLLKLWEGLGYYSRARNMQKAARQIMTTYGGHFPDTYEEIRNLCGVGDYTAGAIASFAFGEAHPAVDGNVLRVVARLTENEADILKAATKRTITEQLQRVMPKENPGDLNQALIELGALVCVPGPESKCGACPVRDFCRTFASGRTGEIPVRQKPKQRRREEKTIFYFLDGEKIAIQKRGDTGLLAGMYELPNQEGHLTRDQAERYAKRIGLQPIHIRELPPAKHVFTHVEWHMIGYEIKVDELEKTNEKNFLFIRPEEIQARYPMPSAFDAYLKSS